MKCPFCKISETEVIETRDNDDIGAVRRRRQCLKCEKRFTTYEKAEELPAMVIKKDGRQEKFSEEKLKKGLTKACKKTKIEYRDIEKIVSLVIDKLFAKPDLTIKSQEIGEIVSKELKKIDKVAYIRFASVFKEFTNIGDFKKELKKVS